MGSEAISESSFTAVVNAPIEKVDLANWLFGLSDAEYQRCSPAPSLRALHDPRMANACPSMSK